jgi:hypothetical protein
MASVKKAAKIVAIVALLLIAIPLLVALFVKKEYHVEREVMINRPLEDVFEYVKYLKNQDNFSVWASRDPNMKQEFRGTDGTIGFVSAWEGNKDVGKGEQAIVNIIDGERIDYTLRFIEPWEGYAESTISTEGVSEVQTRVVWRFESSMPYPFNVMLLFMNMDDLVGNDLQAGLNNLRLILERE